MSIKTPKAMEGLYGSTDSRSPTSTLPAATYAKYDDIKHRFYDLDLEKILGTMEKGHRICKLALGKRWEPTYRRLCFSRETRQLMLAKVEASPRSVKPSYGKGWIVQERLFLF